MSNASIFDVQIVPASNFVTVKEARRALGVRRPWLNILARDEELQHASTVDGPPWDSSDIGFTRDSVERQAEFWSSASRLQRGKRKCSLMAGMILNGI